MDSLVKLLTKKGLTISSVESLTAGLFCAKIAEVEHASAILYGGLTTYQTACKLDVLKADRDIINNKGVISEECAYEMCVSGQKMFQTDIVVSCTGNAGPDAMDNKEVGLVYVGVFYRGKVNVFELHLSGNRNIIRNKVVDKMCELVKNIVLKEEKNG